MKNRISTPSAAWWYFMCGDERTSGGVGDVKMVRTNFEVIPNEWAFRPIMQKHRTERLIGPEQWQNDKKIVPSGAPLSLNRLNQLWQFSPQWPLKCAATVSRQF